MNIDEIPEIYYITTVDQIESIIKYGILSHNLIEKKRIHHRDISNPVVQEGRSKKNVMGRNLHDYANLYFAKRHPMHYNMYFRQRIAQEEICYICIDRNILLLEDTIFSDGHAIYPTTNFYSEIDDFDKLAWDIIKDPNFLAKNPDGTYKYEGRGIIKQKKQAEVLVPNIISAEFIQRIIVNNQNTKQKIEKEINRNIKIDIDKSFYFGN